MKMKLGKKKGKEDGINPDSIDYSKKILHAAWHPENNIVAVGASNNLFLFSADK
jgi:serine/threonine-protein phosphatase 2A regulatory subunit B